jgi:hypothetical protein
MKKLFGIITLIFTVSLGFISCEKKPLTLDKETPMKRLLKASDEEIAELVVREAKEKANLTEENIEIEYILRDEKNQAIAVKIKQE